MKVTGEKGRRMDTECGKIVRKDESRRRDRQKKDEWIGGKMSRKDENHRRDTQKKEDWMRQKMSRDESCLL